RATGHALLCLTTLAPGGSGHVVAVGSAARHITLIDPRAGGVVMTLRGHKNKIASLARDPGSAFGLVSGAHDGTVRVWDVRSSREGNLDEGGRVGEAVFVVGRDGAGKSKVGGEGEKVLLRRRSGINGFARSRNQVSLFVSVKVTRGGGLNDGAAVGEVVGVETGGLYPVAGGLDVHRLE
ncbi:hypothetical protein V491_05030, partial [Pseudogymnoascus sp. VKM F-3775]